MAKISQKTIDLITNTADIVDVISDYVQLQPSGSGFKGLCPFHSEKTPSFNVSKEKGIFKCFGCGEAGNAVTFIQRYKNITYPEALLALADKYHLPVETEGETFVKNDFSHFYEINDKVSGLYQLTLTNLAEGKPGLDYVLKRGLDIHTIQYFELGYATNDYSGMYNQLKDQIDAVDFIELGLVKKTEKDYVDLFRDRLIFPIRNEYGKTVGFSGREINGASDMKYINSPQSKIFTKGNVLFNLDKAIPSIKRENRVVLFEGFFDVIASVVSGIKESVCSMGTALTEEQAKLLKKYTDHAVICYDGDKAGFEATNKAIPLLQNAGLSVSIVLLPEGLDPDEFVKTKSRQAFQKYVNTTQMDPFEFQYVYLMRKTDMSMPSQIEEFKLKVFKTLQKQNSDMLLEIYMKKMSEDIGVSYESIQSDLHNYQLTQAITFHKEQQKKQTLANMAIINKKIESENRLVSYFLKTPEYRQYIIDEIQAYFAKDRINVMILFEATGLIENNQVLDLKEQVLDGLTGNEYELAKRRLNDTGLEYSSVELKQIINTHKICEIEMNIRAIKEKLTALNDILTKEEKLKFGNEILEAKKQIDELKKENTWKKAKS
ncbi:MAG: DNA primase [Candidatus Izemoplasmatales bacterium]